MHKLVRTLSVVAFLAVACGPRQSEEPTPRADLVGVWDLETVNGATLPASTPEEQSVVLESLVMTLEAAGAYSLESAFRVPGQTAPQQMTIGGTWVASDDALTFHNTQGPAVVHFGYRRDGPLLRMVDEQGHEWAMRRRP